MTATTEAIALAKAAAGAAAEKLAERIVAFDVSDQLYIADIFLLCSAANDRQVRAIVDAVQEHLREHHDLKVLRREGEPDRHWVLLDFGDLVVHVQLDEERAYYDLERLWADCPVVPLPEDVQGRQRNAAGGR